MTRLDESGSRSGGSSGQTQVLMIAALRGRPGLAVASAATPAAVAVAKRIVGVSAGAKRVNVLLVGLAAVAAALLVAWTRWRPSLPTRTHENDESRFDGPIESIPAPAAEVDACSAPARDARECESTLGATCEWNKEKSTCAPLDIQGARGRVCSTSRLHTSPNERCLAMVRAFATRAMPQAAYAHLVKAMNDFDAAPLATTEQAREATLQALRAARVALPIVIMSGTGGSGSRAFAGLMEQLDVRVVANNPEKDYLMGLGAASLGKMLRTAEGNACFDPVKLLSAASLSAAMASLARGLAAAAWSVALDRAREGDFVPVAEVTTPDNDGEASHASERLSQETDATSGESRMVHMALKHGSLMLAVSLLVELLGKHNVVFVHYVRDGRHMAVSQNHAPLLYLGATYAPDESVPRHARQALVWTRVNRVVAECAPSLLASTTKSAAGAIKPAKIPYVRVRYEDFTSSSAAETEGVRDLQAFVDANLGHASSLVKVNAARREVFRSAGEPKSKSRLTPLAEALKPLSPDQREEFDEVVRMFGYS